MFTLEHERMCVDMLVERGRRPDQILAELGFGSGTPEYDCAHSFLRGLTWGVEAKDPAILSDVNMELCLRLFSLDWSRESIRQEVSLWCDDDEALACNVYIDGLFDGATR